MSEDVKGTDTIKICDRPISTHLVAPVASLLVLLVTTCTGESDHTFGTDPLGSYIEQTEVGSRPPADLVASFDGLGFGFQGPHGGFAGRNPSDNSLAVGPNHIVQTVNSSIAIFTEEGERFNTTGEMLYGPVPTNTVFHGFGGTCEGGNNGDAVVRYDQLADRWLIVMPIFRRSGERPDQPNEWTASDTAYVSPPGVPNQAGPASNLFIPSPS